MRSKISFSISMSRSEPSFTNRRSSTWTCALRTEFRIVVFAFSIAAKPGESGGPSHNQTAECFRFSRASYQSWVAAIDTLLDLECLFLGVLAAEECFVDIFSFPPHLDSPGTAS